MTEAYDNMLFRCGAVCWRCGRGEVFRDKPRWWGADWRIHRHHFASRPRIPDCRSIVLLCPACHGIQHGERYAGFGHDRLMWQLKLSHMMWIKKTVDPDYYDRDWIQKHVHGEHWRGKLPRAQRPPSWRLPVDGRVFSVLGRRRSTGRR